MEPFAPFQEELVHGDNMFYWAFSPEPAFDLIAAVPEPALVEPPVVLRSAFELYTRTENESMMEGSSSGTRGRRNIHRRVMEMLQRIPRAEQECKGVGTSRGFRHMMRERQRREKLSQSYADLHSSLSYRSKVIFYFLDVHKEICFMEINLTTSCEILFLYFKYLSGLTDNNTEIFLMKSLTR